MREGCDTPTPSNHEGSAYMPSPAASAVSQASEPIVQPTTKKRGRPFKNPAGHMAPPNIRKMIATGDSSHAKAISLKDIRRRGNVHLPEDGRREKIEVGAPQIVIPAKRRADSPCPVPKKKNKGLKCFSDPKAPRVHITVGEPGHSETFEVFHELITSRSPYFKRELDRQSTYGLTNVLNRKEKPVDVFGAFSNWVYSGAVECDDAPLTLMQLARLWVAGGEWEVAEMQDEITKLIIPLLRAQDDTLPESRPLLRQFFDYAYITPEPTVLKQLALYHVMSFVPSKIPAKNVKRWVQGLPVAMQTDLMCEIIRQLPARCQFSELREREMYNLAPRLNR